MVFNNKVSFNNNLDKGYNKHKLNYNNVIDTKSIYLNYKVHSRLPSAVDLDIVCS